MFGFFGSSSASFNQSFVSTNVAFKADGQQAVHTVLDDLGGVVFLTQTLSFTEKLAYFEVVVENAIDTEEDGLTLGVTTQMPTQLCLCVDDVDNSWSVGFDGRAHIHEISEMQEVSWNPKKLRIGASVGFLVASDGAACVVVDGKKACVLPGIVPSEVPLYGVIDMLGNTKSVSLNPSAQPPANLKGFCMQDVRDEMMEVMYATFAGTDPYRVDEVSKVCNLVGIPDKVTLAAKKAMYKGPAAGAAPKAAPKKKSWFATAVALPRIGLPGRRKKAAAAADAAAAAAPVTPAPEKTKGGYGEKKRANHGWGASGAGNVMATVKAKNALIGLLKAPANETAEVSLDDACVEVSPEGESPSDKLLGVPGSKAKAKGKKKHSTAPKGKPRASSAKKKSSDGTAAQSDATSASDATAAPVVSEGGQEAAKALQAAVDSKSIAVLEPALKVAREAAVDAPKVASAEKALAEMQAQEAAQEAVREAEAKAAQLAALSEADRLKKEAEAEAERQKRLQEMKDAIASSDIPKIEAAMEAARTAGVDAAEFAQAEQAIKDINIENNRKLKVENMETAMQSGELEALKAAIAEAREAGVDVGDLARAESGLQKLALDVEKKLALAALRDAIASENIEAVKTALVGAKEVQARSATHTGGLRASIARIGKRLSVMVHAPDEIADAEKVLKELERKREEAKKKLDAAMDMARQTNPPTVEVLRNLKDAEEEAKPRGVDTKEAETLHESLIAALAAAKKAAEEELMAAMQTKNADGMKAKLETCKVFGSDDVVAEALKKLSEMISEDMTLARSAEREQKIEMMPSIESLLNVYRTFAPGCHVLRKMHNDMQDLKGALRVFCRIRPLNKREIGLNDTIVVQATSEMDVSIVSSKGDKNDFSYDAIFGQDNTQDDVFEECRSLIQSAFDGYMITIFTYGQTGAGKTWTLYGIPEQPGVSPRTCAEVFEVVKRDEDRFDFEISASMVELYNSQVRDLLSMEKEPPKLDIKQEKGPDGNMLVKLDANVVPAKCVGDLDAAVGKGFGNRKVASTSMNADSSRSHLLFMIFAKVTEKATGKLRLGKITIVDLAGSERLAKSQVEGNAQKEAIEINKSLTALGDVMMAITSKAKMVPYRNHKLTLLMQDSLGGSAKTLMFVNISPASNNADETINALKYASRARSIENEAKQDGGSKGKAKAKPKAKK